MHTSENWMISQHKDGPLNVEVLCRGTDTTGHPFQYSFANVLMRISSTYLRCKSCCAALGSSLKEQTLLQTDTGQLTCTPLLWVEVAHRGVRCFACEACMANSGTLTPLGLGGAWPARGCGRGLGREMVPWWLVWC